MARRDVDVVIGARTDDASFNRAKQRTEGLLTRIRTGGSGGGGADPFERTAKATELLGKLTQAVVLLQVAGDATESIFTGADAAIARFNGNIQKSDESILKLQKGLKGIPLIGGIATIGDEIGQRIFGDRAAAEAIQEKMAASEKERARNIQEAAAVGKFTLTITERIADSQRLAGKEGLDLELERSRMATERQLAEIRSVSKRTQNGFALLQLDEAALAIAKEQSRVEADIAARRTEAATQEKAKQEQEVRSMQDRIDAVLRAGNAEDRLFGLEGDSRAIEAIRLRTEARERELAKMIEQAKTSDQRLQIEEELARVRERSAREIGAVGNASSSSADRQFSAVLPTLSAGLLTSGAATSAAAGRDFQIERRRISAEAQNEREKQTRTLAELLDVTRRQQSAPILN